jgi:hypothetical protein
MNGFQKTVLMVALIILTVTLAIIGVLLYNNQTEIKFPPEIGNCPDYYTADENNKCQNTLDLKVNNPNCNTGDFSSFTGDDANKNKCNWAKTCGVTWDGITNKTPPLC